MINKYHLYDSVASKICDCHVHFGQFREDYYSPDEIINLFDQLGISKVGIMPISMQSNFNQDIKTMSKLPSKRFVPYLWVNPEMVDADPTLKMYDSLNFKVIKIHAYARKEWYLMPDKIRSVIHAAYLHNVPVMFHTGGWRGSNAIQYYKFCREFPEVNFILAHGKPISQTITVLKGSKNVYVDNSFMDIESMKIICETGLSDRILFGTDFPIMKSFWPEINLIDWYRNNIIELIDIFGERNFTVWSNENFNKLI